MNSPNELKRNYPVFTGVCQSSYGFRCTHLARDTKHSPHRKVTGCRRENEPFQKTMVVSVCDIDSTEVYNEVAIIPAFPISFELNAELSALSWEAYDNHLPLDTLWEKYEKIIARPKMDPLCTLFLVWDLPMHHSAPCSVATGLHVSLYSLPLS